MTMRSRVAVALLSMPLAVAGWLTAHSVAYMLAASEHHERAELLAATGHGYLELEPLVLACGLVLLVGGMLASVTEGVHDRPRYAPAVWIFTLMPVLGFDVIEPLERFLHDGAIPYGFVFDSTFLVGIALQFPFALAALALAALGFTRALHGLARSVGWLLRRLASPASSLLAQAWPPTVIRRRVPERAPGLPSALLSGHGPRAPPASAPA